MTGDKLTFNEPADEQTETTAPAPETKPAKTVPPKATKGKGDDKWKPFQW